MSTALPFFYFDDDPAALGNTLAISDTVEVHPCAVVEDSGGEYVEQIDSDDTADMFSVYAHFDPAKSPLRGIECLADFATRAEAEAYAATLGLPVN